MLQSFFQTRKGAQPGRIEGSAGFKRRRRHDEQHSCSPPSLPTPLSFSRHLTQQWRDGQVKEHHHNGDMPGVGSEIAQLRFDFSLHTAAAALSPPDALATTSPMQTPISECGTAHAQGLMHRTPASTRPGSASVGAAIAMGSALKRGREEEATAGDVCSEANSAACCKENFPMPPPKLPLPPSSLGRPASQAPPLHGRGANMSGTCSRQYYWQPPPSRQAPSPSPPSSTCSVAIRSGEDPLIQYPGLSTEDREYILSAAFAQDFGNDADDPRALPTVSTSIAATHLPKQQRGEGTPPQPPAAVAATAQGKQPEAQQQRIDHGSILPWHKQAEHGREIPAVCDRRLRAPPQAAASTLSTAMATCEDMMGDGTSAHPLRPHIAHSQRVGGTLFPPEPSSRLDGSDARAGASQIEQHSVSHHHHHDGHHAPSAAGATPMPVDPMTAPCKEFLYTQAGGAAGRSGASSSSRGGGGLGFWGRNKNAKKPYYMSLAGEKKLGLDAFRQSKADAEAIRQGRTFTHMRGQASAQQRRRVEEAEQLITSSPLDAKASLGFEGWGLPEDVVRSYDERGVKRLFDWQVECLQVGDGRVLRGGNLVYSAPTSGGKTMVAEILMLRALTLREEGTALFVVPFIALAEEKARYFRRMWGTLNLGVKSFHSEAGDTSLTADVHVAVCTIERANALVNHLLELGELRRLSIVVVDELHMIGDDHRGYLIEVMLSKLRMASAMQQQRQGNNGALIQIVGLSATLPNLPELGYWLAADLYVTDFRPVALSHHLLVDDTLWLHQPAAAEPERRWSISRRLPPPTQKTVPETQQSSSSDGIEIIRLAQLCQETVTAGDGVLVFCNSRRRTQTCAEKIAKRLVPPTGREHARMALVDKVRACPVGLQPELQGTLPRGVAFHHAGMTMEERALLEEGFRSGAIVVLVATSTLAAGVNLPARRVIIRCRKQANHDMDLAQFKQMCGRAGRLGMDSQGEAILMTVGKEKDASRAFMEKELPAMRSVLREAAGKGGVTRAVLEVIAGRMACGHTWLEDFMRCTLLAQQVDQGELLTDFKSALSFLLEHRFITRGSPPLPAPPPAAPLSEGSAQQQGEGAEEEVTLETTQLGMASFFSAMAPSDAQMALQDMRDACSGLVLSSDLHLLFLSVPTGRWYFRPPWDHVYRSYGNWSQEVLDVADRVGLTEQRIDKARKKAQGAARWGANDDELAVRFLNAVALHEKLQEVPLIKLPSDTVERGTLQRLQWDASMYCGMLVCFCRKLKWDTLATLFSALQDRLAHGAPEELLPLMRLGSDIMHVRRARALFSAGLKDAESLAQASAEEVAVILKKARPFTASSSSSSAGQQHGARAWCLADSTANKIARDIVQRSREAVRTELVASQRSSNSLPGPQEEEGEEQEDDDYDK